MPLSTCMACGEVFSSTGSFDKHRIGEFERYEGSKLKPTLVRERTRRCMTREEMLAAGMVEVERPRAGTMVKRWLGEAWDPSAPRPANWRKRDEDDDDTDE